MSDDEPYTNKPELFDETSDSIAFAWGLWHGFKQIDPRIKHNKSTEANPYYYYPGFIGGYMLKAVAIYLMATNSGVDVGAFL